MKTKSMVVIFLGVFLLFGIGYSETVIPVAADADENANLTAALAYVNTGAVPDAVIELVTDGGMYTLNASDSVMYDLTIRAAEGLIEKPTIMPGDTIGNFLVIKEELLTSSITLKLQGIKFDGRFADGSLNPFNNDDFIAIDKGDAADRNVLPNLIVENCDFSYCYEKADPAGDSKGSFFRIRDYGTAGNVSFENCTFMHNADEAILLQKASGRDGVIRAAESLTVKNCTFVHTGNGSKVQGLIAVKGDKDSTTADCQILVENVTVYNSYAQVMLVDDCENTIVRNLIVASPDTSNKDNTIVSIEKASSSLSNIAVFNVEPAMDIPDTLDAWEFILENAFEIAAGRYTGGDAGVVDVETIYNFDPMFADAANGDFTLLEGSPAYGKAHDGGALGDLNWATNATSISRNNNSIPVAFTLSQNYPNPFNPTTTIDFSLVKKSDVKLHIYDITGGLVETLVNGNHQAGNYSIHWNASNVATGTYFYQLRVDGQTITKKMVLLK